MELGSLKKNGAGEGFFYRLAISSPIYLKILNALCGAKVVPFFFVAKGADIYITRWKKRQKY